MSTYYVDPAASGSNTGADWTNAWTSVQSAADTAAAGDIVYCRGTQTLTVPIDYDINSGSDAGGYIKFIGCAADGSIDGTRFVLDGNSAAANCILIASQSYIWWENIEYKNATGSGVDATSSYFGNIISINCSSHNNGGDGWDFYYSEANKHYIFIKCVAYSNTGDGFGRYYNGAAFYAFCISKNNTAGGFDTESSNAFSSTFYGCISHNNGANGVKSKNAVILNSVIDENDDDGINVSTGVGVSIGNRITDNGKDTTGYGINAVARILHGWNFLIDNDSGTTTGLIETIRDGSDADTNETSGTEGYVDGANDDFNLTSSATLRRKEIVL